MIISDALNERHTYPVGYKMQISIVMLMYFDPVIAVAFLVAVIITLCYCGVK